MKELSVFVDESGDIGGESDYYLISLVFHDQSEPLSESISKYELALQSKNLPNIPMHFGPLIRGEGDYRHLPMRERMHLLAAFNTFCQHTPFEYHTFWYKKTEVSDAKRLGEIMRRDLVNFIFDHLAMFQQYDAVKVYYDNGQPFVTQVLHGAFRYALWEKALVYRRATPRDFRLFQIADYACSTELTALKYESHAETPTDRAFFGLWRDFKKNYLRKLRRHRM